MVGEIENFWMSILFATNRCKRIIKHRWPGSRKAGQCNITQR
jgi:hypothetical protein